MPEPERTDQLVPQRQHNEDRMRRAHSWIKRSKQKGTKEIERFMFLWIAFNAAYGDESALRDFVEDESETYRFTVFLENIVRQDRAGVLERIVWDKYPGPIRILLDNHYVFQPFWKAIWDRKPDYHWKQRFESDKRKVKRALSEQDVLSILSVVFRRLYTLRNQLFHGGATWPSGFGHDQLRDGSRIMASLVPTIVDIMQQDINRDPDSETWGKVAYPHINERPD